MNKENTTTLLQTLLSNGKTVENKETADHDSMIKGLKGLTVKLHSLNKYHSNSVS